MLKIRDKRERGEKEEEGEGERGTLKERTNKIRQNIKLLCKHTDRQTDKSTEEGRKERRKAGRKKRTQKTEKESKQRKKQMLRLKTEVPGNRTSRKVGKW